MLMLSCVQSKEVTRLRNKLDSLKSVLDSPKPSNPTGEPHDIDLGTSTDVFATPKQRSPPKKRPRNVEQPQRTADVRVSPAVGSTNRSLAVGNKLVGKRPVKVFAGRQPAGRPKPGAAVSASAWNISGLPPAANVGAGVLSEKIVSFNFI